MKISTVNGTTNTSQLSHRSFPDAVLLLDITLMSEKRQSLFFQHRLDTLSSEHKKQLLNEHSTIKNKSKGLGLDAKTSLPLKSKVPEHRWIVNSDKGNHVYILLVVSNTPESLIKRLHKRLQGKVAQVGQKQENFGDVYVQEKFTELVDSFNDAIKKQHVSDFASSTEVEGTVVGAIKCKIDIEQPLQAVSVPDSKPDNKLSSVMPRFNARTLKIAVIVMVGVFLLMCMMHRFTAPQRVYQLKNRIHRKH